MELDIQLANLSASTVAAGRIANTHEAQRLVFLKLMPIVERIVSHDDQVVKSRETVERCLRELILGEFGTREGTLTMAFSKPLFDAFKELYVAGDTKNTLTLASELQDMVLKKSKNELQSVAALHALRGMFVSRGKFMTGHLQQTVKIAEVSLEPRSKQLLNKLVGMATTGSPAIRVAAVNTMMEAACRVGEGAVKPHLNNLVKVLARAGTVKSSVDVRRTGAHGLLQFVSTFIVSMVELSPPPVGGGVAERSCLYAATSLLADPDAQVRDVGAQAVGLLLSRVTSLQHLPSSSQQQQQQPTATTASPPTPPSPPHYFTLSSLPIYPPPPAAVITTQDAIDAILHTYEAERTFTTKHALAQSLVVLLQCLTMEPNVEFYVDTILRLFTTTNATTTSSSEDYSFLDLNCTNLCTIVCSALRSLTCRFPERLQIETVKYLIQCAASTNKTMRQRRCSLVEAQILIATLGEACSSFETVCVEQLLQIIMESAHDDVAFEGAASMRTLLIAIPRPALFLSVTQRLLSNLVVVLPAQHPHQNGERGVLRVVHGLCAVVRAAASTNRGGSIHASELFGAAKALTSRLLDYQNSDPTLEQTKAGWTLVASLLCLGPAYWGPHIPTLMSLWDEAARSSSVKVQEACLAALCTLLRHCDEAETATFSRATWTLLRHVMGRVPAPAATGTDSVVLQAASLTSLTVPCSGTSPNTMLDMCLSRFASSHECTSFLQPGGLLHASDDFLHPSDDDGHVFAPTPQTLQEAREEWFAATEWHTILQRHAQSRPSFGVRLSSSATGRVLSDHTPLSLPCATAIVSTRGGGVNTNKLIDMAISCFANAFARQDCDDITRHRVLTELLMHGNNHVNVVAAVLAALRITKSGSVESWQGVCRDLLIKILVSSKHPNTSRAAAQALTLLSRDRIDVRSSVSSALEGIIGGPTAPTTTASTEWTLSGAIYAVGLLKREFGEEAVPSDALVFGACKSTAVPQRIWALHSLSLIAAWASPDMSRTLIKPVMALLNAHFMADRGPAVDGRNGTLMGLLRLANCVASSVGPELAMEMEITTSLFDIWSFIVQCNNSADLDAVVIRQCVKLVESFALFNYEFISVVTHRRVAIRDFMLTSMARVDAPLELVSAMLSCILRLCERDSASWIPLFNVLVFDMCDGRGRRLPFADAVPLTCSIGPANALRKAWMNADVISGAEKIHVHHKFLYAPTEEEQMCFVVSEMLNLTFRGRSSNVGNDDEAPVQWFNLLASRISQGEETQGASRETRWQIKCAALECLNTLVRLTASSLPVDALLGTASQATTCLVGGTSGVRTLQARGLASLNQIVIAFAPQRDVEIASVPMLRQYEAQLNAAVKSGLDQGADSGVVEAAAPLAASMLIHGVSTSYKRIVGMLEGCMFVGEGQAAGAAHTEEEEEEFSMENKPITTTSTATTHDDADMTRIALAGCAAMARLVVAAGNQHENDARDSLSDMEMLTLESPFHVRSDVRAGLTRVLNLDRLQARFILVVRDGIVLDASRVLGNIRRHRHQATYPISSRQQVELLCTRYHRVWPLVACACSTPRDAKLVLLACARCVDTDDTVEAPLRALYAIKRMLNGGGGGNGALTLDEQLVRYLCHVLIIRAYRAHSLGKDYVLQACLACLHGMSIVAAATTTVMDNETKLDLARLLVTLHGSVASKGVAISTMLVDCMQVLGVNNPYLTRHLFWWNVMMGTSLPSFWDEMTKSLISHGAGDFVLATLKDFLLDSTTGDGGAKLIWITEMVLTGHGFAPNHVNELRELAALRLKALFRKGNHINQVLHYWPQLNSVAKAMYAERTVEDVLAMLNDTSSSLPERVFEVLLAAHPTTTMIAGICRAYHHRVMVAGSQGQVPNRLAWNNAMLILINKQQSLFKSVLQEELDVDEREDVRKLLSS